MSFLVLPGGGGGIVEVTTDNTLKGKGNEELPLGLNEDQLNALNKFFISGGDTAQITANRLALEVMMNNQNTTIQRNYKTFSSNTFIFEKEYSSYRCHITENTIISFDTSLLDSAMNITYVCDIDFIVSEFSSIQFPANIYFHEGNQILGIGAYYYRFISRDNGVTWIAFLLASRIQYISNTGKYLYVGLDGDDANDGLTWATCKRNIQNAINIANPGDAVLVKQGKYLPTQERTAGQITSRSFVMRNGVHIYGGFIGTESDPGERVMENTPVSLNLPYGPVSFPIKTPKFETILSGEVNGDSILQSPVPAIGCRFTESSMSNNSRIIVFSDVVSIVNINGVVVSGAYSLNSLKDAAIYCNNEINTIVTNSIVRDNSKSNNTNSSVAIISGTMKNTIVHYNTTQRSSSIKNTTISYSLLEKNTAILFFAGETSLAQWGWHYYSLFRVNAGSVGPSYLANSLNCVFDSCSVLGIGEGGAAHSSTLTNCTAKNCSATVLGGAFYNCVTTNCIVKDNKAHNSAGVHLGTHTNALITNNNATNSEAGGASEATLINCTVVRNQSNISKAGVKNCVLKNTVVWGNRSGIYISNGTVLSADNSAFEDETIIGTNNISLSSNNEGDVNSPKFVNPDAGNFELQADSILVDAGDDSFLTTGDGSVFDNKRNPRKDGTIDIGCFELIKIINMIHLYKIFGKIVDGQLELAPDVVDNIHGFKYNESLCIEHGYKEVKYITTVQETIFTDKGTHIQQELLY